MQLSNLLILALTSSTTLALPALLGNKATLTSRQRASPAQLAASSVRPSMPASTGTSPGASAGNSTSSGGACSDQVLALAAGIQSNIDDQNNELTTVNALGMVLAQNPMDVTLYGATQTSLMGFVTKGITIRENNQKIAPADNGAIAGLAIVAGAQKEELSLTMSLAVPASGAVDPVAAGKTVETLKKDFAGGIDQNKKNLAAATAGCTPPAAKNVMME
ncbi:hypothetical protein BKA65DRAFT_593506 [Rhexocercosporidium sp. MPI-PUGE-AT-0058]|nr:hypothetical protein BKA65DRAFT_593506 [Rhexocercosporidium sp. MPI-PUGE-AT-0058]